MSSAAWAERYARCLALALTPLEGKQPIRQGWQLDQNLIRRPEDARAYWTEHPRDNMGACLEPSGLVSLDADYPEGALQVLAAEGIDLEALIAATPTIVGRAPRLEFRSPGLPLKRKSVVWPPRTQSKELVTVLELRAGRVQDALPPSLHPETHRPYYWLTPPQNGFPPLPDALLRLWNDFDAFKHRARNLCPWAEPEPKQAPRAPPRPLTGPSVIAAFNAAHDAAAILESHGYVRAGRQRWKSPHCRKAPGVVRLPDGRIYCHDCDDALGDEKAHDAFDLYALFEHAGNRRAAVRAAARLLGLDK